MAKYLLINPSIHDVNPSVPHSQPSHLLRIGAYLRSQGNQVKLFDFEPFAGSEDLLTEAPYRERLPEEERVYKHQVIDTGIKKCFGNTSLTTPLRYYGKSYSEFKKFLVDIGPQDEIFISSLMTYHYRAVHEISAICKEVYPKAKVTLGGIYASLCAEHAKKSVADEIYIGEIAQANTYSPAIDLLESVPKYTVIKSRWGCPYNCSYCAVPALEGRKVRSLAPELVFQHMKQIHLDFGIRYFVYWDSNILINWQRHLGPILDMVRDSGLDIKINLAYGFQPNLLTKEFCIKMKEARVCDRIQLPIESVEEYLYKERFGRRSSIDDLKRCVDMLNEAGFYNIAFYVLAGMADQSMESIIKSCILAWKLGRKPSLLFFTPIPKSKEYEKYFQLIKDKDLEDLNPFLFPFANTEKEVEDNFWLLRIARKDRDQLKDYFQEKRVQHMIFDLMSIGDVDNYLDYLSTKSLIVSK